jgi:acetyl-CoA C-acetyltransferase
VLAAEGKAEKLCKKPAWIQGVHHIAEFQTIGARDLTTSASTALAAKKAFAMAGIGGAGDVDVIELHAQNPVHEMIVLEALGLDPRAPKPAVNPSGGALCADPIMSTGLDPSRRDVPASSRHRGRHAVSARSARCRTRCRDIACSRTSSGCSAPSGGGHEPAGRRRRRRANEARRAPVRRDASWASSARPSDRALADAGLEHKDIDAVIIGKAPDMLEGVAQPEQMLVGALGAHMKPMIRVHTAGSVGASTAITRRPMCSPASTIASSPSPSRSSRKAMRCGRCRRRCRSRRRSSRAPAASSRRTAARTMTKTGAPAHIGPMIAANARDNAGPERVRAPDRSDDGRGRDELSHAVGAHPIPGDVPVVGRRDRARRLERGAGEERAAEARVDQGRASYAEAMWVPGRDQVSPRAGKVCAKAVYDKAGIKDPWKDIQTAEIYVPFSWFEAMWLENLGFAAEGDGWKVVDRGDQKFGRHLPINPSGGVLCTNPIGASGMIRLGEAALQVMGRAGAHQVEGIATRSVTPTAAARSISRCGSCRRSCERCLSRQSCTRRRTASRSSR